MKKPEQHIVLSFCHKDFINTLKGKYNLYTLQNHSFPTILDMKIPTHSFSFFGSFHIPFLQECFVIYACFINYCQLYQIYF